MEMKCNSVSKSHCYFTRKAAARFKMKYFEELKYEEISEILGHISRCFEGIIPSCGKKNYHNWLNLFK
jgi:hypothetical protein